MNDREFALEVVSKLQGAGYTALWAGGCVRDEVLGLKPLDYDIATSARPEQLRPLFKRRNEIGAHFGVVQVIGPRGDDGEWLTIEVATFRSDGAYIDGRRPESVVFSSPELDANRRDFTINGMFFDPLKGELIDFVGGRADLEAKVLRAIGDPAARFAEDKLRILRAARMATRYDLSIDHTTLGAARRMAAEIRVVSAERIADELRKLLVHPNRGRGIVLLRELGLAEPILPEASGSDWDRVVKVVASLGSTAPLTKQQAASFPLAFAALLHLLNVTTAEAVALRLRLSNTEAERACWLVANQSLLLDAVTMRPSKLKPSLAHPGIGELLALHRAIAAANDTGLSHVEFCEAVIRDTPQDVLDPPPVLKGADLIAMGLKPGPAFKPLLDAVREAQLDDRVATKEQAQAFVRELIAEPEASPVERPS